MRTILVEAPGNVVRVEVPVTRRRPHAMAHAQHGVCVPASKERAVRGEREKVHPGPGGAKGGDAPSPDEAGTGARGRFLCTCRLAAGEPYCRCAGQQQTEQVAALGSHRALPPSRVRIEPAYGAGSREGGALRRTAASPAATKNANNGRPCCRQVATTVRSCSANRLPASLLEPILPLRHSTAGRRARSATLLVGSTPSTRAKIHSARHHLLSSRHSAAAFRSGFSCPRRNSRPSRAWSGISRRRNSFRLNSLARKQCQSTNSRSISASPQRPIGSASPPRSTRAWKSLLRWAKHSARRSAGNRL